MHPGGQFQGSGVENSKKYVQPPPSWMSWCYFTPISGVPLPLAIFIFLDVPLEVSGGFKHLLGCPVGS